MKNGMTGTVAIWLVVIGGLNWGLVGFFDFNLVTAVFQEGSLLTALVYDLVGLSALYVAWNEVAGKK